MYIAWDIQFPGNYRNQSFLHRPFAVVCTASIRAIRVRLRQRHNPECKEFHRYYVPLKLSTFTTALMHIGNSPFSPVTSGDIRNLAYQNLSHTIQTHALGRTLPNSSASHPQRSLATILCLPTQHLLPAEQLLVRLRYARYVVNRHGQDPRCIP